MDNVSHSLTGLVLAQAGLRRFCPRATAILLVSANAPDLDIVTLAGGTLRYMESHRGYTHTLLFLPVMALVSVLLVAALFRQRLPWKRAWMLGCLGVTSHLLLDWTNSYGVRPLIPFSSRWFYLDLNGLYDGFFVAVLLISVVWPFLANLVSREIGDRSSSGRGVAIAAIALILLFECGRAVLHARVVGQLEARVYEGQQPLRTAALPDPFNPFRWRGIVETDKAFISVPTSATGQLELLENDTYYKPSQTALIDMLKRQESFRFFSYFARFPVWGFVPIAVNNGGGLSVDLTDLRFGVPGSGSFHCLAVLDAKNTVQETTFTVGSPPQAPDR